MKRKADHSLLDKAKKGKNDEFYTQLSDIKKELTNYKHCFKGKTVLCNCDCVKNSNFFKYFLFHFEELKLKKLICSCYKKDAKGYYYEYAGEKEPQPNLKNIKYFDGDGDFRSDESIVLLNQADIVVTNPPFSLFREYVSQLAQHEKQFLIIGNVNAITYKEVYSLIKAGKAWLGENLGRGISGFIVPDNYELYGLETTINEFGERIVSPNNCMWLTNLQSSAPKAYMTPTKKYKGNEKDYPKYDNFDAIHIDKTKNIPVDYDGVMGVPVTFLHKFNPNQFEIIQFRKGKDGKDLKINGKVPFFRILVRKKRILSPPQTNY